MRIIKKLLKLIISVFLIIIAVGALLNVYVCLNAKQFFINENELLPQSLNQTQSNSNNSSSNSNNNNGNSNGNGTAQTKVKSFDCILVLGCGLNINGKPSLMLKDRLDKAFSVYKKGTKLLLSGDNGKKDYDEVSAMEKYLIKKGVLEEDIQKDHAGFSTYESMYRAAEVFKVKNILIVTQKYHLYRSVYDARAFGLNAYGLAADGSNYSGQFVRDLRETVARAKDFAFCIFKPKPTFLGEPIPLI